jgi:hypothetical protein
VADEQQEAAVRGAAASTVGKSWTAAASALLQATVSHRAIGTTHQLTPVSSVLVDLMMM